MQLREPCKKCSATDGEIRPKNGQDCVYCTACNAHQYNAPRVETGKAQRSVTTVHNGVKPKTKVRILERDCMACCACGRRAPDVILHVDHFVTVKDGLRFGLTETELNSDDNLITLCEECNLGKGRESFPLWIAVTLILARVRRSQQRDHHNEAP
jgi:5-methylcytosine-specific restriction endonuclease McrA